MEESNMVLENARPHLKSLSQLAPQLNKATDLFMEEIKKIEAELNQLHLGVEVELRERIDASNSKIRWSDDDEPEGTFYTAWTLGYGKNHLGHWSILIREYEVDVEAQEWVEQGSYSILNAS